MTPPQTYTKRTLAPDFVTMQIATRGAGLFRPCLPGAALMIRAWQGTLRAMADRKGSTAVEYAVIGSAAAAILMGAFQPLFNRIVALLPTYIGS